MSVDILAKVFVETNEATVPKTRHWCCMLIYYLLIWTLHIDNFFAAEGGVCRKHQDPVDRELKIKYKMPANMGTDQEDGESCDDSKVASWDQDITPQHEPRHALRTIFCQLICAEKFDMGRLRVRCLMLWIYNLHLQQPRRITWTHMPRKGEKIGMLSHNQNVRSQAKTTQAIPPASEQPAIILSKTHTHPQLVSIPPWRLPRQLPSRLNVSMTD